MMNVYAGLVKIIKKHDKRTGALLRLPFIQEVLNQPFFETDVLNSLIKECEVILNIFFTNNDEPSYPCTSTSEENDDEDGSGSNVIEDENKEKLMQVPKELAEIENMENVFIKLTLSALHTLEEIRGRSSMVSIF
jgi:SPX domain protein involved in polyphosphate accumulation